MNQPSRPMLTIMRSIWQRDRFAYLQPCVVSVILLTVALGWFAAWDWTIGLTCVVMGNWIFVVLPVAKSDEWEWTLPISHRHRFAAKYGYGVGLLSVVWGVVFILIGVLPWTTLDANLLCVFAGIWCGGISVFTLVFGCLAGRSTERKDEDSLDWIGVCAIALPLYFAAVHYGPIHLDQPSADPSVVTNEPRLFGWTSFLLTCGLLTSVGITMGLAAIKTRQQSRKLRSIWIPKSIVARRWWRGIAARCSAIVKWDLVALNSGSWAFDSPMTSLVKLDTRRYTIPLVLVTSLVAVACLIGSWIGFMPGIVTIPCAWCLGLSFAGFFTATWLHEDQKAMGDFRWHLPVTDQQLASGLNRTIVTTLGMLWCIGLLAYAADMIFTMLAPADWLNAAGLSERATGSILGLLTVLLVSPLLGWASACKGIQVSVWSHPDRTTFLIYILSGLLLLVAFFTPLRTHADSLLKIVGVSLGLRWIRNAVESFRYAIGWQFVSRQMAIRLAITWVVLTRIIDWGVMQQWSDSSVSAKVALSVLFSGLSTYLIVPVASLPMSILIRRHFI